jgi:hypothetical protein
MSKKKSTVSRLSIPRVLGNVEALDEKGIKYVHEVSVLAMNMGSLSHKKSVCMRFGYDPIFYSLGNLRKLYPFSEDLCIDAAGRNHGSDCSVFIKKEDMNKFVKMAMQVAKQ